MEKRKVILGTYDTAVNGWTLTGWTLGAAVQKTNFVEKTGGDGSFDLSTALSDGIARYRDRTLTITLECSDGDRITREAKIRELVNTLDGMRENIELPDDLLHYITGRIHVEKNYNDLAHAAVTITATCEPWKYAVTPLRVSVVASTTAKTVKLANGGRKAVVPVLTVSGTGASMRLVFGSSSRTVGVGTWQLPEIVLTPGTHDLTYSGSGTLVITYREAVLE